MFRQPIFAGLVALVGGLPAFAADGVTLVDRPDTSRSNPHYAGNRPPLAPSPLIKLPVGAVRPDGWLRRQLELQSAGFHGHLGELSQFLRKEGNSWLSADGQGQFGWEEVPYWLKGFGDCAYLLDDPAQIAEAKVWIEAALKSQRADGFFGPRGQGAKATVESTQGKYDLWPNMVMLNCMQSYYEYTRDERILDFMRKYFQFELNMPEEEFLPPFWQQQRAADNLASVYWLYNRTGEPWLLDLAAKIHRRTANWTDGVANWHNVNMTEAFGGPATFWMQSKDPKHLAAAERNYQEFRTKYGQVPGGLFGGDENCRPGFTDPRQAVETCGMAEFMLSSERLATITGETIWADRCEDVAFNSMPAALTADFKALRYLTAPNMATADSRNHAPGIENGGAMYQFDPAKHRCCQHNFGHAWPYFCENLWMATPDSGLAAVLYAPGRVSAKVADGVEVQIVGETHYPFDETVEWTVQTPRAVKFPLYLRIPGWCSGAKLAINGRDATIETRPGAYLKIDREWSNGDRVRLELPMAIALRTWKANHGSVSVDRGPLTYSLRIDEKTTRSGGSDAWPAYEIEPGSPWNYGLVLDKTDPAASFRVERRPWPGDGTPFTVDAAPIVLHGQGKRIPGWQLDRFGLVATLQDSPIRSDQPTEPIVLIPMGAARLRISAFPVIGEGADAHEWAGPPEPLPYRATASHCHENDSVEALKDRIAPANSNDQTVPRFTWWPRKGSDEWVAYDLDKPRRVSSVSVYWFDDTATRGGCALPVSWKISRKTADGWKTLAESSKPTRDEFNTLKFDPVEASSLRLDVRLQDGRSGGILEWRVD